MSVRQSDPVRDAADRLVEVSRRFDARGWVLGTSGNFSLVISRDPFRMAITPSGRSKADLTTDEILEIDRDGAVVGNPNGRPSSEYLLHLQIVSSRNAGAVFHTHSVWSTVLSDIHAASGAIVIEGYEMLKGLEGVRTHEHREWIPILENDQNLDRLAGRVGDVLEKHRGVHGFLLRRHGLYTWGEDLRQATRHIEILEFLFESIGRTPALAATAGVFDPLVWPEARMHASVDASTISRRSGFTLQDSKEVEDGSGQNPRTRRHIAGP